MSAKAESYRNIDHCHLTVHMTQEGINVFTLSVKQLCKNVACCGKICILCLLVIEFLS